MSEAAWTLCLRLFMFLDSILINFIDLNLLNISWIYLIHILILRKYYMYLRKVSIQNRCLNGTSDKLLDTEFRLL